MRWLIVAPLFGLVGAGCFGPQFSDDQFACNQSGLCPTGFDCVSGLCVSDRGSPAADAAGNIDDVDARVLSDADETPDAVPLPDAEPGVVRVNVAGASHIGVDYPGGWMADPGPGGICNGVSGGDSGPIQGTVDDPLFQKLMRAATLVCTVTGLPAGDYGVNMLFAETFYGPGCPGGGGTGSRVFDIDVDGNTKHAGVDVFAQGEGCVADSADADARPIVLSATTTVGNDNGSIEVTLTSTVGGTAILSALEVLKQ